MVAIIIHEGAHAYKMNKYGVAIKRFGIGLPFLGPAIFKFKIGSIPVHVHPFLVGAYVEPVDNEEMTNLSYLKQGEIYGAGVLFNLATAFTIDGVMNFSNDRTFSFVALLLVVFLLFLPKIASQLIFLVGIGSLIFIVGYAFMVGFGSDDVGGPVAVVQITKDVGESAGNNIFVAFFSMLSVISFLLGTTNLLPIPPLDGGRILTAFLTRVRAPMAIVSLVNVVGLVFILGLFIFLIGNDISSFF